MMGLVGVARDVPLAPLTTYRVGGAAAYFAAPTSRAELIELARVARADGLAVLAIGRGSNLLVADAGFDGLVISLAELESAIDIDAGPDGATVTAGAAVALPVLARRTAAAGWAGLVWMVGVPGSVGGAVRMNAGGHGADVSVGLVEAEVLDLRTGTIGRRPPEQLGFRFRHSGLVDDDVVLSASFALHPGDRDTLEAEVAEIVRWRREHQPGGQNAGSVFVNPVPGVVSAGELIDRAGLRGCRIGTARVSEKHANFIQADDGGSADDVRAVIETVRRSVAEIHGIVLRSEIRMVGFEPQAVSA